MKRLFLFVTLLSVSVVIGQAPANYYNAATGTGYTLKTQLKTIITNGHDDQGYNAIKDFFAENDHDLYYENDGSILDPYSENPTGADPYNYDPDDPSDRCGNYSGEGDCYNPEHVVPQSYFNEGLPMKSDAHHLLPTDGRVNGFRSNYPFGVAGTLVSQSGITNPTQNGSKRGNNVNSGYSAGYTGLVFEPINEFKGDIARCIFYFVTRYETQLANFYSNTNATSCPAKNMFDGSSGKSFSTTFLNILYQWHVQDPVSQKEIDRNNAIYAYQGNRNPYVDHPEWVQTVWAANLSSDGYVLADDFTVYPNPSPDGTLTIRSALRPDRVEVIDLSGRIIRGQLTQNGEDEIVVSGLPSGFYLLRASVGNDSVTKRIVIR